MEIPQPVFHTKPKCSYEVRKHDSPNVPLLLAYQCEWGVYKQVRFWPGSPCSTLSPNQLAESWKPDVTFPLERNAHAHSNCFQAKHLIMVYHEFYCKLSKYQIVSKQSSDLDQCNSYVQSTSKKLVKMSHWHAQDLDLICCAQFLIKLCMFTVMSCIIDMQIYNNSKTRLGDSLGGSFTCLGTGSPVKILMSVYP